MQAKGAGAPTRRPSFRVRLSSPVSSGSCQINLSGSAWGWAASLWSLAPFPAFLIKIPGLDKQAHIVTCLGSPQGSAPQNFRWSKGMTLNGPPSPGEKAVFLSASFVPPDEGKPTLLLSLRPGRASRSPPLAEQGPESVACWRQRHPAGRQLHGSIHVPWIHLDHSSLLSCLILDFHFPYEVATFFLEMKYMVNESVGLQKKMLLQAVLRCGKKYGACAHTHGYTCSLEIFIYLFRG